jgi:large subunit ribosomal protein L7/L12
MLQRFWSPDIVELGDSIAGLSVAKAALLNRYLADVHGIEPADLPMVGLPVVPDQIIDRTPPPPSEFDVILEGYDTPRKINVIRTIREHLTLGLKEARDMVDALPRVFKERLSKADAEKLKALLEAAGAKVAVRPSVS